MKLYYFPVSPNSLRVTSTAYHLGIDLELEFIDIVAGKQLNNPEFEKLNPNHRIPTLVDGDFTLWECGAIMLYLAEKHPSPALIPAEPRERMRMHQWMYWSATSLWPAAWTLLWENFGKGPMKQSGGPDPVALAKGQQDFHRYAKVLDHHLAGREYVLEGPTLVDHHLVAALVHAKLAKLPLEGYPQIRRWSENLFAKDYWRRAFKDMELLPTELAGGKRT